MTPLSAALMVAVIVESREVGFNVDPGAGVWEVWIIAHHADGSHSVSPRCSDVTTWDAIRDAALEPVVLPATLDPRGMTCFGPWWTSHATYGTGGREALIDAIAATREPTP